MDIFMELLLSLFFEAPFEMAMESRRLKTWVKTLLFCLLCGAISVLIGVVAFYPPVEPEVAVIWGIWTVFSVIAAVIGHRCKWKNKN